jgi:hypothetical protein
MKPVWKKGLNPEFFNQWEWVAAVVAYDWGDPQPLATLVRERETLPDNVRVVLADIVAGERKPDEKKISQATVKGADRMAAGRWAWVLSITREFSNKNASEKADPRVEPADFIQALNEKNRRQRKQTADKYGISLDTLDELRREFQRKLESWPVL